jgi:hypothetical protein
MQGSQKTRRWETGAKHRDASQHDADSDHQTKQEKPQEAMWFDDNKQAISVATRILNISINKLTDAIRYDGRKRILSVRRLRITKQTKH